MRARTKVSAALSFCASSLRKRFGIMIRNFALGKRLVENRMGFRIGG